MAEEIQRSHFSCIRELRVFLITRHSARRDKNEAGHKDEVVHENVHGHVNETSRENEAGGVNSNPDHRSSWSPKSKMRRKGKKFLSLILYIL